MCGADPGLAAAAAAAQRQPRRNVARSMLIDFHYPAPPPPPPPPPPAWRRWLGRVLEWTGYVLAVLLGWAMCADFHGTFTPSAAVWFTLAVAFQVIGRAVRRR